MTRSPISPTRSFRRALHPGLPRGLRGDLRARTRSPNSARTSMPVNMPGRTPLGVDGDVWQPHRPVRRHRCKPPRRRREVRDPQPAVAERHPAGRRSARDSPVSTPSDPWSPAPTALSNASFRTHSVVNARSKSSPLSPPTRRLPVAEPARRDRLRLAIRSELFEVAADCGPARRRDQQPVARLGQVERDVPAVDQRRLAVRPTFEAEWRRSLARHRREASRAGCRGRGRSARGASGSRTAPPARSPRATAAPKAPRDGFAGVPDLQ